MADEEKGDEFKQSKGAESGKGNPLLTILVLLNTIMMGVVAYFQWTYMQQMKSQPTIQDIVKAEMKAKEDGAGDGKTPVAKKVEDDGILFPLDAFTANLAQSDGPRRFLRLNAVLKFSKNSSEEEFKARKPQIRDAIISILNSKRPDDLLQTEGKSYLKEEIKSAINAFLVDGNVVDVFYVGFQIN